MPKAPKKVTKQQNKKVERKRNSLFQSRPRSFRVGGDIQPARDLTRFVRWPKYVTLQRQKRILLQRLKVPPQIHQFSRTLDKNHTTSLFKLLQKYKPETSQEKKQRLVEAANNKAQGKEVESKKPFVLKYGLNHITTLIEIKKLNLSLLLMMQILLNQLFSFLNCAENRVFHTLLLKVRLLLVNQFIKKLLLLQLSLL
ncbi:hypothetical protein IMG5_057300 [Ichthyophthirius multifiliis]|uniref:60S ribosomal protein L7a n=1 Tax=Ichthyophthirius multifiliis TaxID=5932 RepID=G0QND2_ICHMU|nr:hypothetical protein IMG5_057300 [Ichthyophthirius multifiliis]EGR33265.1 hypothetical protein IMG5_057300 [Ichthyophthirius multifiliis]|eukprot:XP_004037251.1 hypothetical protein IMG5_057300 [Ichthyophthirius multifiliis]